MFKTSDLLLSVLVFLNAMLVYFEFQEHLHSKHVTRLIFVRKRLKLYWARVRGWFVRH